MKHTAQDILNYVEDNDVKFVRLAFCDIFGNQKNISVFAGDLPYAFEQGVCFDGSSIAGFMNTEESDLVLWPDPDTMTILPWRPTEGRVMRMYCDITLPNGRPFAGNSRGYLQSVVKRAKAMGLRCDVGCECEFYLFQTDEHGNPTRIPMDHGGYFDIAPLDKAENIRREICFAMEDMGLRPQHSHHESGFGQNEVDFMYSTALKSADNLNTFKSTVKAIADRNGLFASFMPKPLPDWDGSGMHINISAKGDGGRDLLRGVMAGILEKCAEITLFLNPCEESYRRLGHDKAPRYVTWSDENRSQLIRVPAAVGEQRRGEHCPTDVKGNPYLAYALLIYAGLYGIEKGLVLPPASDINLYTAPAEILQTLQALPGSLEEAAALAATSAFVREHLPNSVLSAFSGR